MKISRLLHQTKSLQPLLDHKAIFSVGQGSESYDTVQANLAQADFNNTLYTLNGDFSPVNAAITQFKSIGFYYEGSVSDNPVSFIVDVSITATVTIKPDLDTIN